MGHLMERALHVGCLSGYDEHELSPSLLGSVVTTMRRRMLFLVMLNRLRSTLLNRDILPRYSTATAILDYDTPGG